MEQHASPPQPDPPSESTSTEIDLQTAIIVVVLIAISISLIVYEASARSRQQCMFINSPLTISAFDEEFSEFIGAGHAISEYNYIEYRPSGNSEIGYGPLFTFANLQIIVGETGSIAAVGHGTCKGRNWSIHGGDKQAGDQTIVLVFKECMAPRAWWNHTLSSTVSQNVALPNGDTLPVVQFWTLLPDDADLGNTPVATLVPSSWYWNGDNYTEISSSDTLS